MEIILEKPFPRWPDQTCSQDPVQKKPPVFVDAEHTDSVARDVLGRLCTLCAASLSSPAVSSPQHDQHSCLETAAPVATPAHDSTLRKHWTCHLHRWPLRWRSPNDLHKKSQTKAFLIKQTCDKEISRNQPKAKTQKLNPAKTQCSGKMTNISGDLE